MSPYEVVYSSSVLDDFERIAEHLFRSYVYFGENPREAVNHAQTRLSELRLFIGKLEGMPHQGVTRDDLMQGLRILPDRRKAVIAFMVDDHRKTVHVLRVFYGGEDYDAVMADMEDNI